MVWEQQDDPVIFFFFISKSAPTRWNNEVIVSNNEAIQCTVFETHPSLVAIVFSTLNTNTVHTVQLSDHTCA